MGQKITNVQVDAHFIILEGIVGWVGYIKYYIIWSKFCSSNLWNLLTAIPFVEHVIHWNPVPTFWSTNMISKFVWELQDVLEEEEKISTIVVWCLRGVMICMTIVALLNSFSLEFLIKANERERERKKEMVHMITLHNATAAPPRTYEQLISKTFFWIAKEGKSSEHEIVIKIWWIHRSGMNCFKARLKRTGREMKINIVTKFFKWPFPASFFFIFVFSMQLLKLMIVSMTGFESQISGIGSDCSTNCATTTAHKWPTFWVKQRPSNICHYV